MLLPVLKIALCCFPVPNEILQLKYTCFSKKKLSFFFKTRKREPHQKIIREPTTWGAGAGGGVY